MMTLRDLREAVNAMPHELDTMMVSAEVYVEGAEEDGFNGYWLLVGVDNVKIANAEPRLVLE
jgi:hypothetical protein